MHAIINGLNMFYEDRGGHETEPIVFLHGFPLDHSMWRHQLDFFSTTHRCIAPDLRGHGGTLDLGEPLQPGQVTIEMMAGDVAALLDHLGVHKAAVCGLSMGGYIAFALWRKHSERISRIILADTKATADTDEAKANRYRLAELVLARGAQAAADAMLPRLVAPEHLGGPVGLEIRRMIESASPAHIANTLHALAARPDATDLLVDLTAPSLIVVGEKDAITPLSDAHLMYYEAERAWRLAVIPGAGHMSPLENPEAFNAAMAEFLSA
jgi:pimeloyl-ACP methyl ester carboxylesterase